MPVPQNGIFFGDQRYYDSPDSPQKFQRLEHTTDSEKLVPKLLTVLREGYTRHLFVSDLSAGIIVGVVALPLAIAFAVASGVAPEQGLATAVVAGFIISLLGGSRVQIGGPTGAFVVLVAEIVHKHGVAGLQTATLMAGALLLVMGLARLGGVIR